ncbi:MAG: hypothetical protein JXA81_11420 [Sedimentisphaerales bacterium]|nr:hypothetical protein [Sedimentisphaerales bacterium]
MENISNISSEDELLQLRNEGKITETEYQDLLATITKPPAHDENLPPNSAAKPKIPDTGSIPPVLWIALVSLALMVFGKLLFMFKVGPIILIDAALSAVLLVGLYLGHTWAYFLTIIGVILGTILACSKGISNGLAIFIIDCLVLVPVLLSRDYFFGKSESSGD